MHEIKPLIQNFGLMVKPGWLYCHNHRSSLPEAAFYKKDRHDGFKWCKECISKDRRKYNLINKELEKQDAK